MALWDIRFPEMGLWTRTYKDWRYAAIVNSNAHTDAHTQTYTHFVNLWLIPKLFSKILKIQTFVRKISRRERVKGFNSSIAEATFV